MWKLKGTRSSRYSSSTLDGNKWSATALSALPPGKIFSYLSDRRLDGPRASLEGVKRKICPCQESNSDPLALQPVA
jgi:hypothetical protein